MLRLNLGCGDDYKEGFLNIDFDKRIKADSYMDLNKLEWNFKSNSIDEIYSKFNAEHLNLSLWQYLNECHRILKVNGVLNLIMPNSFNYRKRIRFMTGKSITGVETSINHTMLTKPTYAEHLLHTLGFRIKFNNTTKLWAKIGFENQFRDFFANSINLSARKRGH